MRTILPGPGVKPLVDAPVMPARISRTIFITLLLLIAAALPAQRTVGDLKKNDHRALTEARSELNLGRYAAAREQLQRLLERYPDIAELQYLSSEVERGAEAYPDALAALNRGLEVDPAPPAIAYRKRAELQTRVGDYVAAAADYTAYLDRLRQDGRSADAVARAEQQVAAARFAAELAAHPRPFTPEPLGPGVNSTEHLEYFPSLSVDGQRLIFTRRVNKQREDFYESLLQEDGTWGPARPLAGVNTPMNEGAQTITADGSYLIFTGCGRPDGQGSCDLYWSERVGDGWSPATNLGPAVNTAASESQPSLSRDGRLLFFASNRPGGLGNDDLYVSGRTPGGGWSKPVNLGPSVNTAGQDRYPFWAADNKTLYFTSTGWPGMGGADLFKTSVNAQNAWEKPENLGYPINTPGEESNLFIALDGVTAFFSKGVADGIDIYTFELPAAIRPAPATYVEVTVVDDETDRPLEAEVRLQTQDARGQVSQSRTDRSGRFLTVLPAGENYGFGVEKEGYVFYSDRFELTGEHTLDEPFKLRIRLKPLREAPPAADGAEDEAVVLRNVFFATGSAELLDLSTAELDRLVALLAEQDGLRVEIAGHTDNVGSDTDNQELSEKRAESVRDYLIAEGIAAERVQAVGYGESRPVAPNETAEGRAENRRTTFRLLYR